MSNLDITTMMMLMANSAKGKTSERIGYGVLGLKAATMARQKYKDIQFKRNDRGRVNVVISGSDDLYNPTLHWLVQRETQLHKTLTVKSRSSQFYYSEERRKVPPLKFGFDGDSTHTFKWRDYEYRVSVQRLADGKDLLKQEYHTLTFSCPSEAARQNLYSLFEELLKEEFNNPGKLYLPSYDRWKETETRPDRKLESLHLPGDQKERIVHDLEVFLHAEDKYASLGIPYHRGYLFHGPPGTGKSSLGKVLASHFKLNTHYLPIADLSGTSNATINSLLSSISPRSILLVEDIDAAKSVHKREKQEEASNLSISTILNILDGPLTPHGLIVIATTNHIEVLDDAIVRAGRFDMIEEVGHCVPEQVTNLFDLAYGENTYKCSQVKPGTSPAEVVEIIKQNFTTPKRAIEQFEKSLV